MNNNSSDNGPYKHFKRPERERVQQSKPKKAHHFVKWVTGLAVVVLVGVPVYLTSNHKSSSSDVTTLTRIRTSASSSASSKSKKIKIVREFSSSSSVSNESSFSSQTASLSSVASSSSSELRTYVVQDGDSLPSITATHGMFVNTLTRLNSITDATSIRAGEALRLN